MTNNIDNKINEIFSEELINQRNLLYHKQPMSNKSIKYKFLEDITDNIKTNNSKIKSKFIKQNHLEQENNDNNDNNLRLSHKLYKSSKVQKNVNFKLKKILKKTSNKDLKNRTKNDDLLLDETNIKRARGISYHITKNKDMESQFNKLINNDKMSKNAKFIIKEENKEKEEEEKENETFRNELKKKKINSKRNYKNIVMIAKHKTLKSPKKKSLFDMIKVSIKESNNENKNEENISLERKPKKNTQVKPRKIFTKSIRTYEQNLIFQDSLKTKIPESTNKLSDRKTVKEKDSGEYIKSKNSKSMLNETIKTNKKNEIKINKNNIIKNSENEFFESSKFSNDSKIKQNEELINSPINGSLFKNQLKLEKGNNEIDNNDNKNNESSFINSDSSENKNYSDKKSKISKYSKKSINQQKLDYKYKHRQGGILSIIPELEIKKNYAEDINANMEIINPENIISLEKNIKQNNIIGNNDLDLKKNNIIINNNVSKNIKNIITCYKKESDPINIESNQNIENSRKINKRKVSIVKVKKKFPFCCL